MACLAAFRNLLNEAWHCVQVDRNIISWNRVVRCSVLPPDLWFCVQSWFVANHEC